MRVIIVLCVVIVLCADIVLLKTWMIFTIYILLMRTHIDYNLSRKTLTMGENVISKLNKNDLNK